MKIKTALVAFVLAAAPGFALADGGCGAMKSKISASNCIEGQVYDAATGTCVPQTTS
ncbi:MAG: hypothetical protein RIR62_980 [Pseudomonadota bacterium]|jgi:hypothetical protein